MILGKRLGPRPGEEGDKFAEHFQNQAAQDKHGQFLLGPVCGK